MTQTKRPDSTAHTAARAPAVAFSGVTRSYGAVRAVDGLDLEIAAGETVALLGRNGAGKSTTLALLLGLLPPGTGSVRLFAGTPETAVRTGRVGAMLQDGKAVPRVTVRELITFVAGTYPRPLDVTETLELAGLGEFGGRRVDRLSGGQAQRVRFAVALAGNPELLVLDEPTAALDVEARRVFWRAMRAYARRGNTVVFSTHYLEEADEHADRIVVMDAGRVVADGTGDAIKRRAGGSLVSFDLAGASTGPLAGLPGVSAVEVRGDRALLRTADSDATVVALAGLGLVRGLQVAPAGLEDAFLALTSGNASPTPAPAATRSAKELA
ncbi:ABC transporter ATP-binding protein [Streptomyces angustmyceticus]|uniref:ABC transporter ATP-binding protein n=1 Tax=Streptomyces angustmyceticus TaxID=285578 RepID=A0A5J4LLA6_9ACTN|nr:ABC transporter ATP-binding protein [Streptomyces angustmyceticus]UAL69462.1 ABC transporter ATP-binding protein [Streptomyces angustmyceticus]GES32781.1 ABC transporter ATP-binding protein [Streptomyces angustmyceticus]